MSKALSNSIIVIKQRLLMCVEYSSISENNISLSRMQSELVFLIVNIGSLHFAFLAIVMLNL